MNAQRDFLILKIISNNTGHCFDLGEFVIAAESLNCDSKYVYALGAKSLTGQYLTEHCVIPIRQLPIDYDPMKSVDQYRDALKNWLQLGHEKPATEHYEPLINARVRTQKARGLQMLLATGLCSEVIGVIKGKVNKPLAGFPYFARPCPVTPRHGFVDSRIVRTTAALNKVYDETKAADPHGEVLLMHPLKAEFSSVITDTSISLGKGTDGATSGKKAITIPCNSNLRQVVMQSGKSTMRRTKADKVVRVNVLKYAGIRPTDGVFFETVGDTIVQLRTGPNVSYSGTRFSTTHMVEARIVYTPSESLDFLVYEAYLDEKLKFCREHGYYAHSVIVHLPGSTLSSHYAVQAITRGFSVITEKDTPFVGSVYIFDRATSSHVPLTLKVRTQLQRAIKTGNDLCSNTHDVAWAVSVIQGLSVASRTVESASMIIAASVLLARVGTALCLGEHRHYYRIGPGKKSSLVAAGPVTTPFTAKETLDGTMYERNQVYHAAMELDWADINTWYRFIGSLHGVKCDYMHGAWAGGYGGTKWGECTAATIELMVALLPVLTNAQDTSRTPSTVDRSFDEMLLRIIAASNKLITLSHNSAKCLTKIVSPKTLLFISQGRAGVYIATHSTSWELVKS